MSAPHPIHSAAHAAVELLTPAGRCDRKGLLIAAVLLLVGQAAMAGAMVIADLPHDHPVTIGTTGVLLWLSTTAVAKRLHDLSLSAWRLMWAAIAVVVWSAIVGVVAFFTIGPAAVEPGQPGTLIVMAATVLPVFAATLWLHLKPGVPGDNAYGPEPGSTGFSRARAASGMPIAASAAAG